jgi:hypothetical protein
MCQPRPRRAARNPLNHKAGSLGMQFASNSVSLKFRIKVVQSMQSEIIALLFPEPTQMVEGSALLVTALLRDAHGMMELRNLKPDGNMLRRARVAGRFNSGKPILDPQTREIIGYEIEPMTVGAS